MLLHINVVDEHRSGSGPYEAGDHLHRGGFSGTVGPQESKDFSSVHLEIDTVNSIDGSVLFVEGLDFNNVS